MIARLLPAFACALLTAGCTLLQGQPLREPVAVGQRATLTPDGPSHADLAQLPRARGRVAVAVYHFRDFTGQYKPAPDSSYSTAMTQGATSLLVKSLLDSGWFQPVEREGLQDLLTERRIARSQDDGGPAAAPATAPQTAPLPPLRPAGILIEGGIIGYESNVRTGGLGARYFGVGASDEYRTDQVTVNLRVVDVRSGDVLASLSTTKTVYSQQLSADVYRFVRFKRLLEAEGGFTRNEPAQLCLQDAIEAAVVHLVARGVRGNLWSLADEQERDNDVLRRYLAEQDGEDLAAHAEAVSPATD